MMFIKLIHFHKEFFSTGIHLSILAILFSACAEYSPSPYVELDSDYNYPSGILVFEGPDQLNSAIASIKEGDLDFEVSNKEAFSSLHTIYEACLREKEEIIRPISQLGDLTDEIVTNNVELFQKAQSQLISLEERYSKYVAFKDHLPQRLKYENDIMAQLINSEGLIIVGDHIFRYEDGYITSAHFRKPELALEAINDKTRKETFTIPKAHENLDRRIDTFQSGCGTTISGLYNIDIYAKVTNTYTPIYRDGTPYYVEEPCEPGADYCDGSGVWITPRILVGYNFVNTRVGVEMKTSKTNCLPYVSICWTSSYKTKHDLTVAGTINETQTRNGVSSSSITKDTTRPQAHGLVTVTGNGNVGPSYTCTFSLGW